MIEVLADRAELVAAEPLIHDPIAVDFDENGRVEFADFFMFSDRFGARLGDDLYDGLYDLDSDGEVGFGDFFLFADSFGKEVDE